MSAARPGDALTRREAEILRLTGAGLNADETAEKLGLSRDTVKTHLRRVYVKLGARNAAHAVALAYTTRVFAVRAGVSAAVRPGYTCRVPKSSVIVPRGAVELLEACARAVLSDHPGAASRFGAQALEALGDVQPVGGGTSDSRSGRGGSARQRARRPDSRAADGPATPPAPSAPANAPSGAQGRSDALGTTGSAIDAAWRQLAPARVRRDLEHIRHAQAIRQIDNERVNARDGGAA